MMTWWGRLLRWFAQVDRYEAKKAVMNSAAPAPPERPKVKRALKKTHKKER